MRSKTLDCGSLLPLAVGSPAAGEVSTHGKADWLSPGQSLSVINNILQSTRQQAGYDKRQRAAAVRGLVPHTP
jgi:hypothetical protein